MKKSVTDKKPSMSIREMAKLAGVSPSTVSRILNDPEGKIPFAPKTRQRIIELCQQKGYQPNVHAKRLFAGRSHVLALAVPPISQRVARESRQNNTNFIHSLAGIEEQATLNDQDLLLLTVNDQFCENKKYRSLFTSRAIDGMLIWGGLWDEQYISELFEENYPIVMIGTRHANPEIAYVGVDNRQAGVLIAQHLIELGHRHVGYITGVLQASAAQERRDGFCQTCQRHNIQVTDYQGQFTYTCGYELTEKLLNQKDAPTAIGAANNSLAIGVYEAAMARGLQVPRDLSIAALEQESLFYNPRLTCIEMPIYKTGVLGTQLLLQLIEDHAKGTVSQIEKQQILPVAFKQGQTTGPAPLK